ncbi:MAG: D-glycero-beta-D-manno-heptose-7-phosphate kinase [Crocinitomicaceae bacterium]|nr:D-glycero-beta-D-manno-heptose-7-phosphate kinase [Crocinitomicaceae bacterium]
MTNTSPSSPWTSSSRHGVLSALEGGQNLRILVLGDLMVDQYLLGNVHRISPEAPVPIHRTEERDRRPGGAANVALNLRALGCQVSIAGMVGNDDHGRNLLTQLRNKAMDTRGIVSSSDRPTTLKTRIMSGGQHLLRVDEEVDTDLDLVASESIIEAVKTCLDHVAHHAILIEDYDKGVLSPIVIDGVLDEAKKRNIPVSVDPKFRHFNLFQNVALFKPNLKELIEGLGLQWDIEDDNGRSIAIDRGLEALERQLKPDSILLTLSENGVRIRHQGQDDIHPAHPREILDVSGAGDTVIAVATVLLAQGIAPSDLAIVANLAGGLVCEKPGVVPIHLEDLVREVEKLPLNK